MAIAFPQLFFFFFSERDLRLVSATSMLTDSTHLVDSRGVPMPFT